MLRMATKTAKLRIPSFTSRRILVVCLDSVNRRFESRASASAESAQSLPSAVRTSPINWSFPKFEDIPHGNSEAREHVAAIENVAGA
jgi:hypothetical protein